MINLYADAPYFVDSVEFSGADGNVLRQNAIFLDGLTQQPISSFTQGIYAEAQWYMGRNKVTLAMPRAWWGAFQYRAGVNTAVYEVFGTPVTNERIRIYHKRLLDAAPGTLVYDAVWPSSPSHPTINMASAGYRDGEIIETVVEVYFPGPTYPKTGLYIVSNAVTQSLEDYTGLPAWPGLPTFGAGSTVTAANLNKLSEAQDWIMTRLSLVPRVPFINGMFVNGTHKSDAFFPNNPRPLHYSWISKGNGQDTMHIVIDYYIFNGQENITVYVGGVLEYISPTLTNGQVGTLDFTFDISSLSDGASYDVVIYEEVTPGQGQAELDLYNGSIIDSRFTIKTIEATDTRSYYTPSAEFDVLESMTYSTLKSRLNNFKTGTENAYNRIIDNDNIFNTARMFRKKVGVDDHQNNSEEWMSLPMQIRIGERYVVAGKNVKIAWGGYSLTTSLRDDPTNRQPYEFANTKELIGSDKVEVREGFFDEFEGLFVGSTYWILGKEVSFFSEYLR